MNRYPNFPAVQARVALRESPLSERLVAIDDILEKLETVQRVVEDLRAAGFTVRNVDLSRAKPVVEVRHTRHCQTLEGAYLKTTRHGADGDRDIYQAPYEGCLIEWTAVGRWVCAA